MKRQEGVTWVSFSDEKEPTSIRYSMYGTGEPTLLFVHGFVSSHRSWALADFPELKDVGRRLIAFDLPGFGGSPPLSGTHTVKRYAHGISAILDAFECERAVLVGNSLGGSVVLKAASLYPERVERAVVQGAPIFHGDFPEGDKRAITVLYNLIPKRWSRGRVSRLLPEALLRRIKSNPADFLDSLSRKPFGKYVVPRTVDPEELRQLEPEVLAAVVEDFQRARLSAVRDILWDFLHLDLREDCRAIRVPVQLVDGMVDYPPVDTRDRLAGLIPGAQSLVIPGAGHLAPFTHAEQFAAAIRSFLPVCDEDMSGEAVEADTEEEE